MVICAHHGLLAHVVAKACDIGEAGAAVLAESLRGKTDLWELYLGGRFKNSTSALPGPWTFSPSKTPAANGIGDIGAVAIASALDGCLNLTSVDFGCESERTVVKMFPNLSTGPRFSKPHYLCYCNSGGPRKQSSPHSNRVSM